MSTPPLTAPEAMVVVSVVNAAGKTVAALVRGLFDGRARPSPEERASKTIAKVYERLVDEVTTNSLRAMIVLWQQGATLKPEQIRTRANKLAASQEPDGDLIEEDPSTA